MSDGKCTRHGRNPCWSCISDQPGLTFQLPAHKKEKKKKEKNDPEKTWEKK